MFSVEDCGRLTSLTLRNGFSGYSLTFILLHLPRLQKVHLKECEGLKSEDLRRLSNKLGNVLNSSSSYLGRFSHHFDDPCLDFSDPQQP